MTDAQSPRKNADATDGAIENWTARRSGAHIVIDGDQIGEPVRLSNVHEIKIDDRGPVAIDKHRRPYRLSNIRERSLVAAEEGTEQ